MNSIDTYFHEYNYFVPYDYFYYLQLNKFYIISSYANISTINTISNLYCNSYTCALFLCNALHATTLVTVYF